MVRPNTKSLARGSRSETPKQKQKKGKKVESTVAAGARFEASWLPMPKKEEVIKRVVRSVASASVPGCLTNSAPKLEGYRAESVTTAV